MFNPADELKEIPNHSSFFILAPDNRYYKKILGGRLILLRARKSMRIMWDYNIHIPSFFDGFKMATTLPITIGKVELIILH